MKFCCKLLDKLDSKMYREGDTYYVSVDSKGIEYGHGCGDETFTFKYCPFCKKQISEESKYSENY